MGLDLWKSNGTTTEFLQHFGLKSLEELPKLKEFQENDLDFVKEKEKHDVVNTETGKLENTNENQQITQNGWFDRFSGRKAPEPEGEGDTGYRKT